MRLNKRIRHPLAASALRLLVGMARSLPESCVLPAGRLLGTVAYVVTPQFRAVAERQLSQVFPAWDQARCRRVSAAVYRHLGMNALEAVRLPRMDRAERLRLAQIQGLDIFRDAFDRGKGLLAISGHIGNWEFLGAYISDLGFPINAVSRRRSNPMIGKMVTSMRESYGVREIDRDTGGFQMVRVLKRGEVLAVFVDQDTRVEGAFLPFLGHEAFTPLGYARLAVRTDTPLVVLSISRKENGTHDIVVKEEVIVPDGREDEVVLAVCRRCNELLSEIIRNQPEQWVWFHERWKRKPLEDPVER